MATSTVQAAGTVGVLLGITVLSIHAIRRMQAPASACSQLCQCNGGVVPCPVPGTTCPTGMVPAMCNGPGGSIIPCLAPA